MAIVKHPAMSMEASGNVGGLCYSTWRGLQIVRGAWTGIVPNTPAQQQYQYYLGYVAQSWSDYCTPEQRQGWEELARLITWRSRLHTSYHPSGYQLFMKWNLQLLACGYGNVNLTAPIRTMMQGFEFFHVIYQIWPTQNRLQLRRETIEVNPYCVQYFRAGPFSTGGRRALEGEYRLKINQTDPTSHFAWYDLDVILGEWYWYKAREVWEWGEAGAFWYCHGQKTDIAGWPPTTYCRDHS